MKPKSAKEKGSKYERIIANTIVESGLDDNARRQVLSGAGYDKGDIRTKLKYTIECKNQKVINMMSWIEQARREAQLSNNEPSNWLLIFSNPKQPQGRDNLVVMEWPVLLNLLKSQKDTIEIPVDKELTYEQKHALRQLKYWADKVLKEIK